MNFIELVKAGRFYYFNTLEDFDRKIDWDGRDLKGITFRRGVEKLSSDQVPPNKYCAYGEKI